MKRNLFYSICIRLVNEDKSTDASIYFRYFATDLIRTQCRELRYSTRRTFYKTKFLRMSPELRAIEIRLYLARKC